MNENVMCNTRITIYIVIIVESGPLLVIVLGIAVEIILFYQKKNRISSEDNVEGSTYSQNALKLYRYWIELKW